MEQFGTVLVLGVGTARNNAQYKIGIFERLRPLATKLYACDFEGNQLGSIMLNSRLIDNFFFVKGVEDTQAACEELKKKLLEAQIRPDVVVSYRDLWLQLRNQMADHYGLPRPPSEAIQNCNDKSRLRAILKEAGIGSPVANRTSSFEDLPKSATEFGFPFFIKTTIGAGAEWARWISDEEALNRYIEDIQRSGQEMAAGKIFLLEDGLRGHEIDADIVIYKGQLVYGALQDNLPLFEPFALETGRVAPSILPAKTQEAIIQTAFQAAKACGFESGGLSVELVLKPDGKIALVEINGRLPGYDYPRWDEDIWGVDTIRAELAIWAGCDPASFLQKTAAPKRALACHYVTTNQDHKIKSEITAESFQIQDWVNFQDFKENKDVYYAEKWINLPYYRDVAVNGHVNIGTITVASSSPLGAFQKLVTLFEAGNKPIVRTDKGLIKSATGVLKRFGWNSYGINRFIIREASCIDISRIMELLALPKQNGFIEINQSFTIPESTTVLLAEDSFSPQKRIVGTITIDWLCPLNDNDFSQIRYAHDLLIHPDYRNLGIEEALVQGLKAIASANGVSKIASV